MSLEDTLRAIVREEIRAALADRQESAWAGCVTLAEAAKLVNVSISTLEKWSKEGLAVVKRGHVRRVDVAQLREFLAQRPASKQTPSDRVKEILASVTPLRNAR